MSKKTKFKTWGVKKIKSILPHREPFIFIDKVIDAKKDEYVIALKEIKKDDFFFKGHFPKHPIMPGVIIVEAMAQTSIILFYICNSKIAVTKPYYYIGKINAEFLLPVFPGCELLLESKAIKILDSTLMTENFAKVNNKIVAKATFVAKVIKK